MWSGGPYGRTLHFGVREHAMGSIMNGIALHGGTRVYGGTFLMFSDYMRGAVRLAALMQLPVTYVWTHDSIGLGEDGPTHQPIEHYAALRAIPGLDFVRPADANETAVAWRTILEHNDRPGRPGAVPAEPAGVRPRRRWARPRAPPRAATCWPRRPSGTPEVVLMGTGSEVQIAVAAREVLEADGVPTRVVSIPCWEWFAEQDEAYRTQVLPPDVKARVSVEAGVPMGWRDFVGDAGRIVGLNHYGASAATRSSTRSSGSRRRPSSPPPARASRPQVRLGAPAGPASPSAGSRPDRRPLDLSTAARTEPHRRKLREGHDMAQNENLAQLSEAGVAVWLDDLSRDRIRSGNLQSLVDEHSVVGVTTNPTIFAAAISGSESYDDQLHALAVRKVSVEEALRTITAADVRGACDLLAPGLRRAPAATAGSRSRSTPGLAHDTDATAAEAAPPVVAGRPAEPVHQDPGHRRGPAGDHRRHRRRDQRQRHPDLQPRALRGRHGGLPGRPGAGGWPTAASTFEGIESVASFFVSRVDTEIDKRLDAAGADASLKGKAGDRQRPAGLPALREGLLLRPLEGAGGQGRRTAAAAVGLDRRQEPRLRRHDVRRRAGRARTRSTPCRRRR